MNVYRRPTTAFSREPRGKFRGPWRSTAYLGAIRKLPCLAGGTGDIEAAHIRYSDAKWGKKNPGQRRPDDFWVVPLSAKKHRLDRDAQHNGNERAFWERIGIDPLPVAAKLYELWNAGWDHEAAVGIIRRARQERGTKRVESN